MSQLMQQIKSFNLIGICEFYRNRFACAQAYDRFVAAHAVCLRQAPSKELGDTCDLHKVNVTRCQRIFHVLNLLQEEKTGVRYGQSKIFMKGAFYLQLQQRHLQWLRGQFGASLLRIERLWLRVVARKQSASKGACRGRLLRLCEIISRSRLRSQFCQIQRYAAFR